MKKFILGLLVLSFSFNGFADCVNSYTQKAEKRARSNRNIKNTVAWTAFVGGVGIGGAALVATSGAVVVFAPIGGIIGGTVSARINDGKFGDRLFEVTENNTFYSVLEAIHTATKYNKLSVKLEEKLNDKIDLKFYSDEEATQIKKSVVDYIISANQSETLCKDGDEFKVLNFNAFSKKIINDLNL